MLMGPRYFDRFVGVTLVVVASACVEPYAPPDVALDISVLVVDGFVNGTDGAATVRLSHATKLAEEGGHPAEKGASVSIKTDAGDSFLLVEQDSGVYYSDALAIDPSKQYQLHIRTTDGQEYVSDYIDIKETPPIDSVTWRPDGDGVSVRVNTHDDSGQSKYYRWDYLETWEYHAPFLSAYTVVNREVLYRPPQDLVFACYSTAPSTTILVASSVRLEEDVIRDFQLTYIPRVSSKLSVKYSVLVQQRVIDETEFEFWQDMQRVTEGLGGLFDSQPYSITGNVYNTGDPSALVLGYFSGGFVDKQRIFIDYLDLPEELRRRPFHGCVLDTVCVVRVPPYSCITDIPSLPANSHLIAPLMEGPSIWGYTMGTPTCSDCRMQGGVLDKPAFWP